MSSGPSANDTLTAYLAGKVTAERVVTVVAAAYYGEGGRGKREGYKPLIEIIERAHPGIVELSGSTENPGFAVRLAERPFPKKLEAELRDAVAKALDAGSTLPASPVPLPGFFARIVRAIKKIFSS